MNLTKLFEMQRELDAKIIKEKGLEEMDRLPYLILALQVELGECANEWRGFKYWSKNQEPRVNVPVYLPHGNYGAGEPIYKNPLLEEYVDCLHFILSIGLLLGKNEPKKYWSTDKSTISYFTNLIRFPWDQENAYGFGLTLFQELGEMLGFTWEQVEQAYMDKNAINHERQNNGY